MKDNSDILSLSAGFRRSRHPKVLLSIPGCVAYAVNPAYGKYSALRFSGYRDLVVSKDSEFIEAASRAQRRLEPGKAAFRDRFHCYCGKVLSILALEAHHCIHESHSALLGAYGGELKTASGWEFNLLDDLSRSAGKRVYQLLRVHSHPVDANVLEVRFVPSESLRLVVTGTVEKQPVTGVVEFVHGGRKHTVLSIPQSPFRRQSLPRYDMFDQALARAASDVDAAPDILNKVESDMEREFGKDGDPAYPVREIIEDLLSDGKLEKRIPLVRARLWDAPLIASHCRRKLDHALQTPGFRSFMETRPLAYQAEVANLMMPLSSLEAADIYQAA